MPPIYMYHQGDRETWAPIPYPLLAGKPNCVNLKLVSVTLILWWSQLVISPLWGAGAVFWHASIPPQYILAIRQFRSQLTGAA
jgi:hypothetical protein